MSPYGHSPSCVQGWYGTVAVHLAPTRVCWALTLIVDESMVDNPKNINHCLGVYLGVPEGLAGGYRQPRTPSPVGS